MNILNNPTLRDKLSAAYVLGTLKGAARRRFESLLATSAALNHDVSIWQQRLNAFAEFVPPSQPRAVVWQNITRQLQLNSTVRSSLWRSLIDSLNFWRAVGLVSSTAAAALLVLLLVRQPEPGAISAAPTLVAMLTDEHAQPNIAVVGDMQRHTLTIKILATQNVAANQTLQLWAIPKHGNPQSLGLLAKDGSISLPLPANATPQNIAMLAVSLEPLHGSPNSNGPTGPVLFKGTWQQI